MVRPHPVNLGSSSNDLAASEFPERPLIQLPGDLLNETFCAELVKEAARELGGLDIVVNNAGYRSWQAGPNYNNISEHSAAQLDRTFRTNFYAPFFISRAAVPLLPPRSSILFTVSTVANSPLANGLDYSASKAALGNYLNGLAQQVAPLGIRVNGVTPGLTYTSFLPNAGYQIEQIKQWVLSNGFRGLGQPSEIAPLFVALADEALSFTSGSILGAHGASSGVY